MLTAMKKIILHIGEAKTGSSALQMWLSQQQQFSLRAGYWLPDGFYLEKCASQQLYCSGNASELGWMIFDGAQDDDLRPEKWINSAWKNHKDLPLILSWEGFVNASPSHAQRLALALERCDAMAHVVLFVRDLYPHAYSLYSQAVKVYGYSYSFYDYAVYRKGVSKYYTRNTPVSEYCIFDADNIFSTLPQISQISVLHYDTCKKEGLEKSFLRLLNIQDSYADSHIPMARVHKSPSAHQIAICQRVMALLKKNNFSKESIEELAKLISCFNIQSEIFYGPQNFGIPLYENIVHYFESINGPRLHDFNEKYNVNVRILNDEVQTFNPEVFHECYHELAETICRHLEKFLATIVH